MIEKLPVAERGISVMWDSNPRPEMSHAPDALGSRRFELRSLFLTGSDVLAWEGRFQEALLLEELRVGWFAMPRLPEDIRGLRQLKTLIVLNCNLAEFPLWICEMTQLQSLTVRGTNITHIPEEISKLVNLKKLELGNNLLTRFDADLRGWRKLSFLSLADNNLDELPSRIPGWTCLGLAGTPFRGYSGLPLEDMPVEER